MIAAGAMVMRDPYPELPNYRGRRLDPPHIGGRLFDKLAGFPSTSHPRLRERSAHGLRRESPRPNQPPLASLDRHPSQCRN